MFIGHFAIGLAAKKVAPRASLGTLMLSTSFIDVLWPFFLIFGWEHVRINPGDTAVTPLDFYHYPYSHSLLTVIGWSILFGGVYFAITRFKKESIVLALGVFSHWFLDFLSHRPDLPILPTTESLKVGLGLWNSVSATVLVEVTLFLAGVWIYLNSTRPKDKIGKWGLFSFVALLLIIYLANIFGPPPPSEQAIAYVGAATLLLFAIPYWVDRHRTSVPVRP